MDSTLRRKAASRTGDARAPGTHRSFGPLAPFAWLACSLEIARQRRALMRLDDSALKDIGLSRADAYREGSRHWWDLPGC